MIIYYITLSYKVELYKYGILKDINFYFSRIEKKVVLLRLKLKLGLWMQYCYHQIYLNRI